MELIKSFFDEYGAAILYTVIITIIGYFGTVIKNTYSKHIDDNTKESVIKICVKAVEQLYSNLKGEEKLNKCIEYSNKMLKEKLIDISDLELRILIESIVNQIK